MLRRRLHRSLRCDTLKYLPGGRLRAARRKVVVVPRGGAGTDYPGSAETPKFPKLRSSCIVAIAQSEVEGGS